MALRAVITGGGTGGHLYPALAVAEALAGEGADILFIGNRNRREAELVPAQGLRFEGIDFSGMPRGLSLRLLGWTAGLVGSFWQARKHLASFRPQIVFGTGGYVTAPVLLAAKTLGIPFVIHEPDAFPGLVNRKLAPYAAAVTCAFEGARPRLDTGHLHVTGNPLRAGIGQVARAAAPARLGLPFDPARPVLLVTGGSQGAQRINRAVLDALPALLETLGLQVLHQTGDKLYADVMAACPPEYRTHPAYAPRAFVEDMAAALALSDIAVCRSGAMTLSEMTRSHLPTILIPYPYAAADHQRQNALAFETAGAAVMIADDALTGATLTDTLRDLLTSPLRLDEMREAAVRLAAPDATERAVAVLRACAQPDAP